MGSYCGANLAAVRHGLVNNYTWLWKAPESVIKRSWHLFNRDLEFNSGNFRFPGTSSFGGKFLVLTGAFKVTDSCRRGFLFWGQARRGAAHWRAIPPGIRLRHVPHDRLLPHYTIASWRSVICGVIIMRLMAGYYLISYRFTKASTSHSLSFSYHYSRMNALT